MTFDIEDSQIRDWECRAVKAPQIFIFEADVYFVPFAVEAAGPRRCWGQIFAVRARPQDPRPELNIVR